MILLYASVCAYAIASYVANGPPLQLDYEVG